MKNYALLWQHLADFFLKREQFRTKDLEEIRTLVFG